MKKEEEREGCWEKANVERRRATQKLEVGRRSDEESRSGGGVHLLSFAIAQVLFETEGVHGAEPRLLHPLYPQHHPAELLTPRHHTIQIVQTRPDLQLERTLDTVTISFAV